MRVFAFASALLALVAAPARAAEPIEVMVLGTYHFANPGLDLHNAQVDDVLLPRRQAELQAVARALAAFRPTRVAVEANTDTLPSRALPRYAQYKAGTLAPDRNEIVQIGYRLAKQLDHAEVLGVDAPGDFPFEPLQKFAQGHGRGPELQQAVDAIGTRTKAFEQRARSETVGQLLRGINEPAAIQADHAWYMATLSYGRGAEQPGAALVGSWLARNVAICARLVQALRPGDRVVLLYGSGHAQPLRQCVKDMPGWRLVEANDYLPK